MTVDLSTHDAVGHEDDLRLREFLAAVPGPSA